MNRNQRIVVSIVGIIIVTLALIGITYAYFLTRIIGNSTSTSISGTLANLELTYGDGEGIVAPTDPIMPGTTLTSKTFTVQNTGTARIDNYAVIFENVTNGLTRKEDLVYTLTCESNDNNPCVGVKDVQFPDANGPIIFNSINKGTTHTYTLTVTYKNLEETDQSDDMGASFSAKVNITDGKNASLPIKTMILLNSNTSRNGTTYRETPLTTPAVEPSVNIDQYEEKVFGEVTYSMSQNSKIVVTSNYEINQDLSYVLNSINETTYQKIYNELKGKYLFFNPYGCYNCNTTGEIYEVLNATNDMLTIKRHIIVRPSAESTLSKTSDEYGTSYYYRGNVEDNYLTFNNMCWRIVRIQGDGSIKIILEDKTKACGSDMEASNSFIGRGTYGYSGGIADYLNCNSDSEECMKNQFDTWFDSNFKNVKDKLKEETWYLGDTTNTHRFELNRYVIYDLYEAGRWLHGFDVQKSVSLLEKSNPFRSYIAPITADEVALAGATTPEVNGNFTYYLYNDRNLYWTLSLDEKRGSADRAFIVGTNLYNEFIMQGGIGLRPTIVLKANTLVSGQGTKADPYIVK